MGMEAGAVTLRYITYEVDSKVSILLFPDTVEHAHICRSMQVSTHCVIGAGLVNMEDMTCYGESFSIDAQATARCTEILRAAVSPRSRG